VITGLGILINTFSIDQLQALTQAQIQALTTGQCNSFSIDQVAAFTPTQLSYFSLPQKKAFTGNNISTNIYDGLLDNDDVGQTLLQNVFTETNVDTSLETSYDASGGRPLGKFTYLDPRQVYSHTPVP